MLLHRLSRRRHLTLVICLLGMIASNAAAAHIPGTVQLGGWVYIDRNNDGHLAFSNEANPEYVIGDVQIGLYLKSGNAEVFVSSMQSDQFGRYLFENIALGTYILRQMQPIEYVDGIDTLGILQSFNSQPIPPNASRGVATNNTFSDIVLPADVGGEYYNFGERGLAAGYVSKRLLFGSAPPPIIATPEPAPIAIALIAACSRFERRRRWRR